MRNEVRRVYSTLLTRVHRKPRTASNDELPVLLGAVDLPVYERDKTSGPMVLCNGGSCPRYDDDTADVPIEGVAHRSLS